MIRTAALVLLLSTATLGQPPGMPPKAELRTDHAEPVPPGVIVTLDATGSVGDDLGWDTEADESVYRIDSGKRLLYFASPVPGVYRFKVDAYGIIDGKVRVSKAKATIIVKGPEPAPQPTPGPAPQPGPTPNPDPAPSPPPPAPAPVAVGPLHAVLVFDVDDPSTAQVRVSAIKGQLAALDCKWSTVATVHPIYKDFKPYLPASGYPAVLILETKDGMSKVVGIVEGPRKPSDVLDKVKALRGVK